MSGTTIRRIFKLGLTNFWRNRWLSLAASLMIMLTLLTIGLFAILNIFFNSAAQGIKDRIVISVYFYENATDAQIQDIKYQLSNRPDVKSITYISKEQALAEWESRAVNQKVKDLVSADNNPLPRSLQIKANDPNSLAAIAAALSVDQYKPIVRSVSFQETKAAIDKLISITNFIHRLGWVLTAFLLLISLVVVLNTIRLTIFTRRDEIEVMRLVGANNSFIRVPFSVEAILYGFVGALLAYLIIILLMGYFGPRLAIYFSGIASSSSDRYFYLVQPYFATPGAGLSFPQSFLALWQLGLLQLAIGVLFSVSCSMIAIRRYLHI